MERLTERDEFGEAKHKRYYDGDGHFQYSSSREILEEACQYEETGLTPEQIIALQAENERLMGALDKAEGRVKEALKICPNGGNDGYITPRPCQCEMECIEDDRDHWKARAEKAEAERDAAIKDIKSVSQCETCAYAGNNPFDGSEYFRCSLGFPCVEGSGFKWRGVVEREVNHE